MYKYSGNNFILTKHEVENIIKCLELVGKDMTPELRRRSRLILNTAARYAKKLKEIHDEQIYFRKFGKASPMYKPQTESGSAGDKEGR